jgi:hypothetical protein
VLIIEVKDWDLATYELDEKKHWHLKYPQNDKEAHAYIKSPIDQVLKYKENLYNLHVEKLLETNIKNPKLWGGSYMWGLFSQCYSNSNQQITYQSI